MTKSAELARVEEDHHLREDSFAESYLDSAIEIPSYNGLNPKQIYAIKHEVIEQFQ